MGRLQAAPSQLDRAPARLKAAPKVADPFYLTPEWKAFARTIKRQRGNVCEDCEVSGSEPGVVLIADHVVERKDGGADFDPNNIRIRCRPCDRVKTAKARQGRAQRS